MITRRQYMQTQSLKNYKKLLNSTLIGNSVSKTAEQSVQQSYSRQIGFTSRRQRPTKQVCFKRERILPDNPLFRSKIEPISTQDSLIKYDTLLSFQMGANTTTNQSRAQNIDFLAGNSNMVQTSNSRLKEQSLDMLVDQLQDIIKPRQEVQKVNVNIRPTNLVNKFQEGHGTFSTHHNSITTEKLPLQSQNSLPQFRMKAKPKPSNLDLMRTKSFNINVFESHNKPSFPIFQQMTQ